LGSVLMKNGKVIPYVSRQLKRRCVEILKDYDMRVPYHPSKTNVVEDALSRFSLRSVAHLEKGKLSSRYIVPYRILSRTGKVAYKLELAVEFAAVHLMIHVSMLKKCFGDPFLIVPLDIGGEKYSLFFEEVLVQILDLHVHKFITKEIASLTVLWRNHFVEEVLSEAEQDMKDRCPELFVHLVNETVDYDAGGVIVQNEIESKLVIEMMEKQDSDPILL
ncbi:hypothetical protein MTR67_017909, partial [Solanum verrucosum]